MKWIVLLVALTASNVFAQQWTAPVRGSWVRADGSPEAGDVTLAEPGRVCDIVVSPAEHSAVKQAAVFLAADIEQIAGQKPAIVENAKPGRVAIRLATLGSGDAPAGIDVDKLKGQWEAYQIVADGSDVWLVGSNFRGTAFASYKLSERIGIDPLHHWTGFKPARLPTLVVQKTNFLTGPPTFKYRGTFHDDEDILPRPFEDSGYPLRIGDVPLEWYQKYFETALRLRMNMVAPYTRVHRRLEVQKTASDWGLFFTSHHYDVLLSNPFGIERFGLGEARGLGDKGWDWLANRDGMLRYWRGGVEENKDLSCIWPVGIRGVDDHGYKFPKGTSQAEQSKVFRDVIDTQVKLVKSLVPADHAPAFHFTLYTEMLEKYQANTLEVPDEVIIVWPDNNDGVMRGLPEGKNRWKHGVYYHLAYLGKEVKQSTHTVSPTTVADEFGKIVNAGATEYMLVNVSEMREFVMETRQLAEICWDANTALAGASPGKRYVDWWCREYFGEAAGPAAAKAYVDYAKAFDAYDKQWYGSERVHDLIDVLSRRFVGGGAKGPTTLPTNLREELSARRAELQSLVDGMSAASKSMNGRQARLFHDHLVLPVMFDYRPTGAALKLLDAVDETDAAAAMAKAREAMGELEQLEVEILRAEHPPFDGWYRKTWIRRETRVANVHRPFEELRAFLSTDGLGDLQEPADARKPDLSKFRPLLGATRAGN